MKQKLFHDLGEKVQNHPHSSQIFVKLFKDELLNSDNKAVFNALPMEAKIAFVKQNKADISFLSAFSNIYKDELAFDLDPMGSSNQELSEIQTAFKDAIIANKADIIKKPIPSSFC